MSERTLVAEDGAAELTAAYVAWSPVLDRVAAFHGTDSPDDTISERTLGLRCDLRAAAEARDSSLHLRTL